MDIIDLKSILDFLRVDIKGAHTTRIRNLCCDSREVRAGDVFVAVRGACADGHDFIDQAVKAGAAIIVSEQAVSVADSVELVCVKNGAVALGELAQRAAGSPAKQLTNLAVTGTNGKTTVVYLVRAMLRAGGINCGMVGTVEYDTGDEKSQSANNTTPGALQLAEMMRKMRQNGLKAMVMECSSHGLDQDRVCGIDFNAAAFTNLSGDHLDYHLSPESYLAAKSKLFSSLGRGARAILNAQDKTCDALAEATRGKVWRYGVDGIFDISAHIKAMGLRGCEFELSLPGEKARVCSPLLGRYNVSNCLAAAGLARAAGVDTQTIAKAIETFGGVPGRLERVETGGDFTVLVDYAHTDDALSHVLRTLRGLVAAKLIVVFGCGGQRDQTKRPRMAAVADRWADSIVLTNDNPRGEDPEEIMSHIRAGFSESGSGKVTELPDRREAIAHALKIARKNDLVLIAGKGHEDYQIVGERRLHFDDREVVKEEYKIKVNRY